MYHHDDRPKDVAELEALKDFQLRLDSRLQAASQPVIEGLRIIEAEGRSMTDYVVPLTGASRKAEFFDGNGRINMRMKTSETDSVDLELNGTSMVDIAGKLDLPKDWLKQAGLFGAAWQRELVVSVMNVYAEHSGEGRVLVRSVSGVARAILSTSYAPWEGWQVALAFADAARAAGAVLTSAHTNETYIYVDAVLPKVFGIELANHGVEYLTIGAQYRTSDFGRGAQLVKGLIERVWCTNRAISKQELRSPHVGGSFDAFSVDGLISAETYEARTKAHALTVRDVTRGMLNPTRVLAHLESVKAAAATIVTDKFVTELPKKGLQAGELETLRRIIMESNPQLVPPGPLTRYKIAQGIGAVAGGADVTRDRRHFLEELAGSLIYGTSPVAESD